LEGEKRRKREIEMKRERERERERIVKKEKNLRIYLFTVLPYINLGKHV